MSSLFCCGSVAPFRPQRLMHEPKFEAFLAWGRFPKDSAPPGGDSKTSLDEVSHPYVIQLVRQVNYGPLESRRYFAFVQGGEFVEVVEEALIEANYQKLNAYKNFRCNDHNKFFELNIYQKDPVNKHHWRANLARPATIIDL